MMPWSFRFFRSYFIFDRLGTRNMAEQQSLPRGMWQSRFGFLMVAVGSAVGLGNIWRFPYLVGENGGAIFVLVYLAFLVLLGIPLILTELAMGQYGCADPYGTYRKIHPSLGIFGFMAILGNVILLSYYSVVGGWILRYLVLYAGSVLQIYHFQIAGQSASFFAQFISHGWSPLLWQFGFLLITMFLVLLGLEKGTESTSKIMMPVLFALLVVLAIFILNLKGSLAGLNFYLNPFAQHTKIHTAKLFSSALGQVFFSISVGLGSMMTYGSYLSSQHSLKRSAVLIPLLDTSAALLAGLVIFPATFAVGLTPDQGPGLLFVTLTEVFERLPFGHFIGFLFFLAAFFATITSAFAMLEVPVAFLVDQFKWKRVLAIFGVTFTCIILGALSGLSFGLLANVTISSLLGDPAWMQNISLFHKNAFNLFDYFVNNIFLTGGALAVAVVAGWVMGPKKLLPIINRGKSMGILLSGVYFFCIRYIAPVFILYIFIKGLMI
jgi:NSS family neurotransmitter:Na+ symporter